MKEMHILASNGSVLSFSVSQYTLTQGNGAEDKPGCVLLPIQAESVTGHVDVAVGITFALHVKS